jgi:hypothetical protein
MLAEYTLSRKPSPRDCSKYSYSEYKSDVENGYIFKNHHLKVSNQPTTYSV